MEGNTWRNISIADILSIMNDVFSVANDRIARLLTISYRSLSNNKPRSSVASKDSVRRWKDEVNIPKDTKISSQVLSHFLYNFGRPKPHNATDQEVSCAEIVNYTQRTQSLQSNDIHFLKTFLSALEQRGYRVDELRMCSRKEFCEKIAEAARATSNQRRENSLEARKASRKAGISPKPPQQSSAHVVEEGTMIKAPHPCFPHRKDHSSDLFVKFYHDIATPYGRYSVPYKELFGHAAPGMKEYIEGKNISFNYEDFTVDYASRVTTCDFQEELQKKDAAAKMMGYTSHPPKLCLVDYLETRSEDLNGGETKYDLSLTFGTSHYLENLVWRDELQRNKKEQEIFRAVLASSSKEHLQGFDHGPWAAAGGGCWVITSDNFLVMSYRSPTRVGEVAGRLGYSASGSYGRGTVDSCGMPIDNTPGNAMVKELNEELGLPEVKPEELVQISLGLDLERGLAQWSYFLQSKYAADDIAYFRQDWATTADEQTVFFVPLETPDICYRLLSKCEFEPGSAFSLYRLLTKRFGPPRYEKN